ncbi:MAG: hypothetical protein RBU21_20085, partial [FCB group bacterium]|nr:hypothetical protein [FCB group bacterium]
RDGRRPADEAGSTWAMETTQPRIQDAGPAVPSENVTFPLVLPKLANHCFPTLDSPSFIRYSLTCTH